jgi:hypothetical protein
VCDVWNNDTLNIIYASHLSTRAGAQWGGGGGGGKNIESQLAKHGFGILGRKKKNI